MANKNIINEDGTAFDGRYGPLLVAGAFSLFLVIGCLVAVFIAII